MVGKLIQLDGVNSMKRYEIRKERVRINITFNPILLRYDFNIIHEFGEIIETLSEEELKAEEEEVEKQPLVILNETEIAILKLRKLLGRNDIGLLTYKETCAILFGTTFEVYAIYDHRRGEYIGYLEDYE